MPKKDKSLRTQFLFELRHWAEFTSVVGPKAVYYTHGLIPLQTIWIICFAIAAAMVVWLYVRDYQKYASYATRVTSQDSEDKNSLLFPLVTICPLNPVDYIQDKPGSSHVDHTNAMLLKLGKVFKEQLQYVVTNQITVTKAASRFQKVCKSYFDANICGLTQFDPTRTYGRVPNEPDHVADKITGVTSLRSAFLRIFNYIIATRIDSEIEWLSRSVVSQLLISCSFNGYKCSPRNFKRIRSLRYGMCYQFHNPNSKNKHGWTSGYRTTNAQPGMPFGLKLDLFSAQESSLRFFEDDSGFIISIHEAGSSASFDHNAVQVPRGEITTITIKENDFEACNLVECAPCLPNKAFHPLEKDAPTEEKDARNIFVRMKKVAPEVERPNFRDCIRICAANIIYLECQCRIVTAHFMSESVTKENECLLTMGNKTSVRCALTVLRQVEDLADYLFNKTRFSITNETSEMNSYQKAMHKLEKKYGPQLKLCGCRRLCKITTYDEDHYYSSFAWQSDPTKYTENQRDMIFNQFLAVSNEFFKIVEKETKLAVGCRADTSNFNCFNKSYFPIGDEPNALSSDHKLRVIEENSARVNIYFRSMRVTTSTEALKYRVIDMLSDMGSQGGMWLGLTILTLVQFLELIITLIVYVVMWIIKKINNKCCPQEKQNDEEEKLKGHAPTHTEVEIPIQLHQKMDPGKMRISVQPTLKEKKHGGPSEGATTGQPSTMGGAGNRTVVGSTLPSGLLDMSVISERSGQKGTLPSNRTGTERW